jgi:hypothetical protein
MASRTSLPASCCITSTDAAASHLPASPPLITLSPLVMPWPPVPLVQLVVELPPPLILSARPSGWLSCRLHRSSSWHAPASQRTILSTLPCLSMRHLHLPPLLTRHLHLPSSICLLRALAGCRVAPHCAAFATHPLDTQPPLNAPADCSIASRCAAFAIHVLKNRERTPFRKQQKASKK